MKPRLRLATALPFSVKGNSQSFWKEQPNNKVHKREVGIANRVSNHLIIILTTAHLVS